MHRDETMPQDEKPHPWAAHATEGKFVSELGRGGVVAAATPEASEAGAEILREGGNAVDAAVAVAMVVGVTEPAGSGIGGQCTLLVHAPGAEPFAINGTSFSPARTPTKATLLDLRAHRASTVPSQLRTLDWAWRNHGSGNVSWERLCEPAVRWAREGFVLGSFRHRALLRWAHALRQSAAVTRIFLDPHGGVPEPGSRVRQPLLADTFERVARDGADDFYEGAMAREIDRDMRDNGGWIAAKDLARVPAPQRLPALQGTYRGWSVHTLPPPAAGWTVLLALNLLELPPQGELAVDTAERWVHLANALWSAHTRRIQRPPPDLVDYGDAVRRRVHKGHARQIARDLPSPGRGETTHFTLVDGDGMVVAVTQSLNSYFGARVVHPKLGFLYNDYMREYVLGAANHPFQLRPGAPPYSSMSASTVARDGVPFMGLGSPGDERIISAVVQVVQRWVDCGQDIAAAVAAPRLHALKNGEILVEAIPDDAATLLALERCGYVVHHPLSSLFAGSLNPYFGGVHAVARENGAWRGAADPRRDGVVVGV